MAKGYLGLTPAEMLEDLWDELARGKVYEANLRSEKFVVDGLQSGQDVFIDPRPAIIETLIHELLHRRKPRFAERTVEGVARRLIASMDEATKNKWYREYRRVVRKAKAVDVAD